MKIIKLVVEIDGKRYTIDNEEKKPEPAPKLELDHETLEKLIKRITSHDSLSPELTEQLQKKFFPD